MKIQSCLLFRLCLTVILFSQLIDAHDVSAATIRVEKDGSGDFTEIQPALNVVASGDTLLIGPGDFTESTEISIEGYPEDVEVFANVTVASLTIIGAGMDQTIIGPSEPSGDSTSYTPKCLVWQYGSELNLDGLTFKNCYEGLHLVYGIVNINNCRILENYIGMIWLHEGDGGRIVNSEITTSFLFSNGATIFGSGGDLLFRNVTTNGGEISIRSLSGIKFEDCVFEGGRLGVKLAIGAEAEIENCAIFGCSVGGIILDRASCHIEYSEISGNEVAVWVDLEGELTANNTIFSGGSFATVYSHMGVSISINNSHILKGAGYSVFCNSYVPSGEGIFDMTNNYWNSTDSEEIASWIWDSVQDPEGMVTVEYLPFSDQEVSAEKKSMGDFKTLFR